MTDFLDRISIPIDADTFERLQDRAAADGLTPDEIPATHSPECRCGVCFLAAVDRDPPIKRGEMRGVLERLREDDEDDEPAPLPPPPCSSCDEYGDACGIHGEREPTSPVRVECRCAECEFIKKQALKLLDQLGRGYSTEAQQWALRWMRGLVEGS